MTRRRRLPREQRRQTLLDAAREVLMARRYGQLIIAGDAGVPVESVLLPAHGIVGTMEAAADWLTRTPPPARPTMPQAAEVLSRLIWQGLEGVGELGAPRRAADASAPVPLRPRRR